MWFIELVRFVKNFSTRYGYEWNDFECMMLLTNDSEIEHGGFCHAELDYTQIIDCFAITYRARE